MDIKKFVLSYYENATENFYIARHTQPVEALKLHSHDYFQVYYISGGRVIHRLEKGDAVLVHGDVFILPPDVPHYIELPDGKADFYSMSFKQGFVGSDSKLIYDLLQFLTDAAPEKLQPKISLPGEDCAFTEVLFNRIMNEFSGNATGRLELIREYASVLLALFARIYFAEQAESISTEANKKAVMYCIEYIGNHLDEDITLSETVKRSAMSKTSFCSIFYSVTGQTFKSYLNEQRIKKAVELISSGLKISEVCSLCGYSDFSTFYRNFKKYTSVSPKAYRTGIQN